MRKPVESIGYELCPTGFLYSKNNFSHASVDPDYRPCLKFLELFSHAILVYQNASAPSQASTKDSFCLNTEVVKILSVDEPKGLVVFDRLEAPDRTPLFDIKPYFPCEDRVREPGVPARMKSAGLWRQDGGSGSIMRNNENEVDFYAAADSSENSALSHQSVFLPPSGYIRKRDGKSFIELVNPNPAGLQSLQEYSHVKMLWWFHRFDKKDYRRVTQVNPPYENAPRSGIYATRSPVRPNPIALTTARIVGIDIVHGMIEISGTDAFDNSPVMEVLPYLPAWDRVECCVVPDWLQHWPQWLDDRQENITCSRNLIRMSPQERIMPYLQGAKAQRKPEEIITSPSAGKQSDDIVVEGARQNNLKSIRFTIPKNKMTVVTGVSGSGKSSLAFDTVYAESRRRFLDSMSGQGISASDQMEKPDFDQITGLPPAIAVEQRNAGRNPRSTVGTMTDLHDYLRLFFSTTGIRHCPECGEAIVPMKPDEIASLLADLAPGTAFTIRGLGDTAVLECFHAPMGGDPEKAHYEKHLKRAVKAHLEAGNGGIEVNLQKQTGTTACNSSGDSFTGDGSIPVQPTPKSSACSVLQPLELETSYGLEAFSEDGNAFTADTQERLIFQTKAFCYHCNRLFFDLSPSLFSFNNPESMCPDCKGLGVKLTLDPSRIVSNPDLSVLNGASKWWGDLRKFNKNPNANWMKGELLGLAQQMEVNLELPWRELPESFRRQALYGSEGREVCFTYSNSNGRRGEIRRRVEGAFHTITRLFREMNGDTAGRIASAFMTEQMCPSCGGERLMPEGRLVSIGGTRFPEAAVMTLAQLKEWVCHLPHSLTACQLDIALPVLKQMHSRLENLQEAGVSYLALDRPVPTLSGGELQRLRLASQLGSGITNILYVLDEPSAGLHPRDHQRLIALLQRLKNEGNTVLVVEHDAQTMLAADKIIDIGPGAGIHGGEITTQGTPAEVMECAGSLTGQYLKQLHLKRNHYKRKEPEGFITLTGARCNNLQNLTVQFPVGVLCCITGVSGSGKSSLIYKTLYPAINKALNDSDEIPGDFDHLEGLEAIRNVISISQQPIGRTPRSNPATYTGLFDSVRDLFAAADKARERGYKQNRFSFNSPEGQCPACLGEGRRRIDMHFMPDSWVECPVCKGRRFNAETLEIFIHGKNIADVLEMNVEEALDFFRNERKIKQVLQTLNDVGLSYIRLGQSALTLSGGEAQRIKLAKELSKPGTGHTLYLLDEPTTGLHFSDIQNLLLILKRMTQAGNTVIVVEHNPDIMAHADWVIDLGPEGGNAGGTVVAQGTPEQVAESGSHTGNVLKEILSVKQD